MHLLHLEDSPQDAELIARHLRREWPGCRIRQAANAAEYRAAIEQGGFEVILSDYTIPGFDGLSALALARSHAPGVPFLFLSGTIGEERAVEALRRGASDYIIKDRPSRLIPAIRHALALVEETRRRRDTERALREQASLLERARDAIIATDLDHRIAYWNASAERLYGWKVAEVLGRRLDQLDLGHDAVRFATARAELLATGEWRGEFRLRTRPGGSVLVESTWSLVLEDGGHPRSILYIDTDVTEKRRIEAQLQRAQRMESIGTLAGGVAHDLNNVLTPILVSMDLLAAHASDDEDRALMEKTRASAAHGAALVRQLLAFARGAEGRRTRLDPAQALAELQPLIRQSLPAAIAIEVHCAASASIHADATQFNQVVVNLCLNARDVLPQGGRVEISTHHADVNATLAQANPGVKPGPFVRLSVADNGPGIPSAILDKIFDPFFTTKPVGKGTGPGLSVVAGIMRGHGGFVHVESEPGRGATFHLFFPAQAPLAPAVVRDDAVAQAARGAGEGILLIDDEPIVRDTLQLLLQREGYRVFPAGDADGGVGEFSRRENEIALVITDMMLPDRSGLEMVRTLRGRHATLPIIAISGMMASGAFDELLHLQPPVECLAKPLSPRELLRAVRRRLPAPAHGG